MSSSGVKRHNQSLRNTKNTKPRHGGSRQGAGRPSNFARAQATAKRDLNQGKLIFTSLAESIADANPSLPSPFDSPAQTNSTTLQNSPSVNPQESSPNLSSPFSEESSNVIVDTEQETKVFY